MTAPYIIRAQLGYWHSFNLPVAHINPPVGVLLIIYLQPGEKLECETLLNALKPALLPAPPGQWYKVTVDLRYIREQASTTSKIIIGLVTNDPVQVTDETVYAYPGYSGKVIAARIRGTIRPFSGYVYLGSLVKVLP